MHKWKEIYFPWRRMSSLMVVLNDEVDILGVLVVNLLLLWLCHPDSYRKRWKPLWMLPARRKSKTRGSSSDQRQWRQSSFPGHSNAATLTQRSIHQLNSVLSAYCNQGKDHIFSVFYKPWGRYCFIRLQSRPIEMRATVLLLASGHLSHAIGISWLCFLAGWAENWAKL